VWAASFLSFLGHSSAESGFRYTRPDAFIATGLVECQEYNPITRDWKLTRTGAARMACSDRFGARFGIEHAPVRIQFGIEEFSGKLNGIRTLQAAFKANS